MSLLPPNITQEERDIIEAINYPIDPSVMRGFKFEPPDPFLAYLIWEYGLGELLRWLPDPRRAIREGVQWQRIRGTPKSLKIALGWANLQDIFIEEEVPGEHFAEFQVGAGPDVPNDLFIDAVIELAKLSAPIRSRLTRMYNDRYDIRRFILDSSDWGDMLSDYSGCRITPDGPVLSFGRYNSGYIQAPDWILRSKHCHESHVNAIILDTYRLDQVDLSESDWHVLNHKAGFGRIYSVWNDVGIVLGLPGIIPEPNFVKAQIVLSDSWVLGDINACFPVNQLEEEGRVTLLDDSKLSDEIWRLEYVPLNERFYGDYAYDSAVYDQSLETQRRTDIEHIYRYDENIRWPELSEGRFAAPSPIPRIDKEAFAFAEYGFMNDWHDFQHLDRPWTITDNIVQPVLDRWLYVFNEAFADQRVHKGAGLSEYILSALREATDYQCVPVTNRDRYDAADYHGGDMWHDFSHLDRPWSDKNHIMFKTLERDRAAEHSFHDEYEPYAPIVLKDIYSSSPSEADTHQGFALRGRDQIGESEYDPASGWHGHRHLNEPWTKDGNVISPIFDRIRFALSALTGGQQAQRGSGVSEYLLEALRHDTEIQDDPLMQRDRLAGMSEYHASGLWHDHAHLNRPWSRNEHIISRALEHETLFGTAPFSDQHVHKGVGLSEYVLETLCDNADDQNNAMMVRGQIGESYYSGADSWHSYKHQNRPWNYQDSIVDWSAVRHMRNGSPHALDDQVIHDPFGESDRYAMAVSDMSGAYTPIGERELLASETVYPDIGWHGYQHLNKSWDASPAHIETSHTQVMQ